jgi:hypothetical protein
MKNSNTLCLAEHELQKQVASGVFFSIFPTPSAALWNFETRSAQLKVEK